MASANAVSEGGVLFLTCYGDGDGQAVLFRRDGLTLRGRFSVRFLNCTAAVYRISPVVSVDGGVYHCTNSLVSVFVGVTRGGNPGTYVSNLIAELIC